jgi:hypothetical protein
MIEDLLKLGDRFRIAVRAATNVPARRETVPHGTRSSL